MIRNGKDYSNGTELATQVCIIGTGAAGITLAWNLIKQNPATKVILIDSGRDFDSQPSRLYEDKQLLYNGEALGIFPHNESDFLVSPVYQGQNPSERELYFGGTTIHFGGQSRPFDPIDFLDRQGYPGWPITRDDLDPYYKQAATFCHLAGDNFDADYWAKILNVDVPHLTGFDTDMYQFMGSQYLNFSTLTVNGQTLATSSIVVIRNATLLNIENKQGSVSRLSIGSMSDSSPNTPPKQATQFYIKADAYVLATGAVANARQLLLSNVANSSGNVGRNFMCHPVIANYMDQEGNPITVSESFLTPSQVNLMNGRMSDGTQWTDENGVRITGRFIPNAAKTLELGIGRCWFNAGTSGFYFELAPSPDNQITLSDQLDPVFGQKLTKIVWNLTDLDEKTYNATTNMYKEAVQELNSNAEVTFAPWSEIVSRAVPNGHHLGTTKMSVNPADGVVDANLLTYDLNNLYIAGSSVWPSAAISNPTFTIIALSIRLAEYINKTL